MNVLLLADTHLGEGQAARLIAELCGRTARLRRWFPQADIVVFGHSHIPWHHVDVRPADGHVQHHVNPGSAMQRRAAPEHTAAVLQLHDGVVTDVSHIVLA